MAPPTLTHPSILGVLADGQWHSGVGLGAVLRLSRAAVWRQVRGLRTLGLTVEADRATGYRLKQPLDLLNGAKISAGLAATAGQALASLDVLVITTSTNRVLGARASPVPGKMQVLVAEYQTDGRGRRGRRWFSPLGHGVCLSISWCFEIAPRDLPALSLVAGVAVVRSLAAAGVAGVQLKWPNDVMAGGGKVGGILVEVSGEPGGPLRAVIGIGLNVRPIFAIAEEIGAEGGNGAPVALDDLVAPRSLDRNVLVTELINSLHGTLTGFAGGDWDAFRAVWRRHDYLAGRAITVTGGRDSFQGVARGIGDDGSLLVEVGDQIRPVVAGDVTLREPVMAGF